MTLLYSKTLRYLPGSNFHLRPFTVRKNIGLQGPSSVPDVRAREFAGGLGGEVRRWGYLLPLQVSGSQARNEP
jgi:hypothetical protein